MAVLYSIAAKRTGKPFWNYIQCGYWSETEQYRGGEAEFALQIFSSLALGARGLVIFPGCYPNDWLGEKNAAPRSETCGLLDRYGDITENYFIFRRLLSLAKEMSAYLLTGEYLGASLYGKLPQLLHQEKAVGGIYAECGYFGTNFLGDLEYRDKIILEAKSNSQILLGVVRRHNAKILIAVNMSGLLTHITTIVNVKNACRKKSAIGI